MGLANKIQRLKQPKPGSPVANLIERMHHIERCFEEAVSQFGENARSLLNQINAYRTMEMPAWWVRDHERWEDLRGKALKLIGDLSALINKLERGHRQVVIKKCERLT